MLYRTVSDSVLVQYRLVPVIWLLSFTEHSSTGLFRFQACNSSRRRMLCVANESPNP